MVTETGKTKAKNWLENIDRITVGYYCSKLPKENDLVVKY